MNENAVSLLNHGIKRQPVGVLAGLGKVIVFNLFGSAKRVQRNVATLQLADQFLPQWLLEGEGAYLQVLGIKREIILTSNDQTANLRPG